MKRKTITLVIYMLVCISLVSVGFAAWVITGGDETKATGNVTASAVSDHSLTISNEHWDGHAVGVLDAGQIIFGKPAGEISNEGKWLQVDSSMPVEQLTDSFVFDVECDPSNVDGVATQFLSDTVGSSTCVFKAPGIAAAIEAHYIQEAVVTVSVKGTNYQTTSPVTVTYAATHTAGIGNQIATELKKCTADYKATVTITITYKWGFGTGDGQNPFTHYGSIPTAGMNDTAAKLIGSEAETRNYKEQAKQALTSIYAANGSTITLEVKLDSKGAN